jgi:hypothetical protein
MSEDEESRSSASSVSSDDGSVYEDDASAHNDDDHNKKSSYYVRDSTETDGTFNYDEENRPSANDTPGFSVDDIAAIDRGFSSFSVDGGEAEVLIEPARFPENLERSTKDWFETLTPAEQRLCGRPLPKPRKPHLIFPKEEALRIVGDFDGKTAMDLYNAGVPLIAKASKVAKDGSGDSLNEIVGGNGNGGGESLFIRRIVFVCGPVLEGEFDRIEHVNDQTAIDELHREGDRKILMNRGTDERLIDLPKKFSLWDASTGELLISSSTKRQIRSKTGADVTFFTFAVIHDAIAANGEYLFRKISSTQDAFSLKYEVDLPPIANAAMRIERIRIQAKQYKKSCLKRW